MRKLIALVVFALPVLASAQARAPYASEKVRDNWYIGFGVGGGDGSGAGQGDRVSFKDMSAASPTTVFLNFHVGATLSPKLLLGGEIGGVAASASSQGIDSSVGISTLNAVATYFPMGHGLSLKGGVGLAQFSQTYKFDGPYADEKYSRSGLNATVGIGYAWWLGRSFNLSVNLDLAAQSYGSSDTEVESSRYGALYVGFDWF